MKKTDKVLFLLIIAVFTVFLYSCRKKEEPAVPVVMDTIITFVSGEAYILDTAGEKKEAEIGEKLMPDYELLTMEDSFLEFQIGGSGVIRMDSDTRLSLSDISEKRMKNKTSSDITLSLAAGTVIQKVKKLTEDESYHIRTASAAFGVRGTEFLVRSEEGHDTLAVGSGSVIASLFPGQLEKLKSRADEGDEEYGKIYKTLEESFPLLKAGEEISVSKSDLEATASYLEKINILFENAELGKVTEEELVNEIKSTASEAVAAVSSLSLSPAALSEQNSRSLKSAEKFTPEKAVPDTELYIKTEPASAAVYFDDNLAGYGSLKALFSGERLINIRVEKDGYYPFEKEIRTGDIKDSPYIIKLEKKEGSVSLQAFPSDSEITVEGVGSFRGSFSRQFDPGTELTVTVTREEYKTAERKYSITEDSSIEERIVLDPLLVPLRIDTGLESGAFIIRADDDNILSAGNGSDFSFFSKKGLKKWNFQADYAGTPIVSGDSFYYVSGKSLEKRLLDSGESSGSIEIADALYNKPEFFENFLFINSGTDVLKIDPGKFESTRIYTLPDPTVSNPYYYGGKLFSVTDKGVLHIYGNNKIADSSISVTRGNPEGIDIAAAGKTAFFAGLKGEVFAMDIETAEFTWDSSFESDGTMPEISIEQDRVILKSGKKLNFFDKDGELLFSPDADIDAWAFISPDEFVYVAGGNTLVFCSGSDGSIFKKGVVEDGITDLAVINGRIYTVMNNGNVIAVNPDAIK